MRRMKGSGGRWRGVEEVEKRGGGGEEEEEGAQGEEGPR